MPIKIVCSLLVFLVFIHSLAFASVVQIPADEIRSLFKSVIPGMTRDEAHSKALDGALRVGWPKHPKTFIWMTEDFIGVFWNYTYTPIPRAVVGIYLKDGWVRCVHYYIDDGKRIVEDGFNTLEENLDLERCLLSK